MSTPADLDLVALGAQEVLLQVGRLRVTLGQEHQDLLGSVRAEGAWCLGILDFPEPDRLPTSGELLGDQRRRSTSSRE